MVPRMYGANPIFIMWHRRSPRALCIWSQLHLQPFSTSPSIPKLYPDNIRGCITPQIHHLSMSVQVSKPLSEWPCVVQNRAFLRVRWILLIPLLGQEKHSKADCNTESFNLHSWWTSLLWKPLPTHSSPPFLCSADLFLAKVTTPSSLSLW